jgi:hypothetical protein
MSGIEIVGLVLGCLPIMIASIRFYETARSDRETSRRLIDVDMRIQVVSDVLEKLQAPGTVESKSLLLRQLSQDLCDCRNRSLQLVADTREANIPPGIEHLRDRTKHDLETSNAARSYAMRQPFIVLCASAQRAWMTRMHQKDVADAQFGIHVKEFDQEADEKQSSQLLEHTDGTCRCQCENSPWNMKREQQCSLRSGISATQVVKLVGRMLLMYQMCMLIMSNYAITNERSKGCDSWVIAGFQNEVSYLKKSLRALADVFQSSAISRFAPEFVLHPSPYVFIAASMAWTFLEWAQYRSNLEHRYQLAILGLAIVLGLLPAVGCTANMIPLLFCTLPWAIDLGLLVSDILHSIQPRDRML